MHLLDPNLLPCASCYVAWIHKGQGNVESYANQHSSCGTPHVH